MKEDSSNALKQILAKLRTGAISADEAHLKILALGRGGESNPADALAPRPTRQRGRPKGIQIVKHAKTKRKRGRPQVDDQRIALIVWAYTLLRDKMPVMKLRDLLADILAVDDSAIGRVITRMRRMEKCGSVFVRTTQGDVVVLDDAALASARFAQQLGLRPSSVFKRFLIGEK